MDAITPPMDADQAAPDDRPSLERAQGAIRLAVDPSRLRGTTALKTAFQQGSFKVRFPRRFGNAGVEAVLLNTAGGLTDGDRFTVEAVAGPASALTLTTQAAERVYRSRGDVAYLDVELRAGPDATLLWLPQETILYDRGRVRRSLTAEMAGSARILLCEILVLGRTAHGETVREGTISDRWRIRRDGRLVYADDLRLNGDIQAMAGGSATLAGARAFASLVSVAPDAEAQLDAVRAVLDRHDIHAGASAWDGLLAVRAVASDAARLRAAVVELLSPLAGTVPRVWSI